MVLDLFRKSFDPFIEAIAKRIPLKPNTISALALFFAILAFFSYLKGFLIIGSVMVLLNGLFDVLDGAVAKVKNMQSKRGDMVDHVLDRYADVLIMLGLSFNCNVYLALVAIATVLLISYLGVESQALLSKRDYGGLLGRADRLVLLIIIPIVQKLLGPCWTFLELNWNLIDLLMIYFIVVGTITVLQRSHRLWKELGDFRQQK